MIYALAAFAGVAISPVRIVESPQPEAKVVVVQAFVKGGPRATEYYAAWRLLGVMLLDGTDMYTPADLMRYGSLAGIAPRVEIYPDFMTLTLVAPEGRLELAASLMTSLLTEPSLEQGRFVELVREFEGHAPSPWQAALAPFSRPYGAVKYRDVVEAHAWAFRPENVVISVGGRIEPGSAMRAFGERMGSWSPGRKPPRYGSGVSSKPLSALTAPAAAYDFVGPPVTSADGVARSLLAVTALGVGRGSALHRVVRESEGVSYAQEALLWPTADGLRPRLLLLHTPPEVDADLPAKVVAWLKADVGRWQAADRERALAVARAALTRPDGWQPIPLPLAGIADRRLAFQVCWRGYASLCGWQGADFDALIEAMDQVGEADLRTTATEILDQAIVRMVPGR